LQAQGPDIQSICKGSKQFGRSIEDMEKIKNQRTKNDDTVSKNSSKLIAKYGGSFKSLNHLLASGLFILIGLGCASTNSVVIRSDPPAAKVFYVDMDSGQAALIGETPVTFERQDHANGKDVIQLRLEKEGYQSAHSAVASFSNQVTFVDLKLATVQNAKAEVQQAFEASRSLLIEANRLILGQRFSEGLSRVEKIIELDPKNAEAFAAKGSILYLMKDFDGARESWTKSLELNPSQSLVRESLLDLNLQINASVNRSPASKPPGGQ
jgi:tetratricopeptide (TPR) repeat protein